MILAKHIKGTLVIVAQHDVTLCSGFCIHTPTTDMGI